MPQYDFLCRCCQRIFSKILTLADYEEADIRCPVEQGRWVVFHMASSRGRGRSVVESSLSVRQTRNM